MSTGTRTSWALLGLTGSILMILLIISAWHPMELGAYGLSREQVVKIFGQPFLQQARRYNRLKLLLYGFNTLLNLAALGWLAFTPSGRALVLSAADLASSKLLGIALAGLLVLLVTNLVALPLSFYSSFLVEHWFGLSHQGLASWWSDWAKNLGLSLLMIVGWVILFWLMARLPRAWPWIGAALFSVFLIVMYYLVPVVVAPLFNNFTPLEQGPLRQRIETVVSNAGLHVNQILVMDASRRTSKVNAYFSGVGNTQRIVLYDTLVKKFSPAGVEAVMAHESGHWKNHHIEKGLALGILGSFIAFGLGAWLISQLAADGYLQSISDPRALPALMLAFALFGIISMPVQNRVSRHFERVADKAVFQYDPQPQVYASVLVKLGQDNLGNVAPNRYLNWYLDSHPPIVERIATAVERGATFPSEGNH